MSSQITSIRRVRHLSLSLFFAGYLYGQGTVVEVHKLPSISLAAFQNTFLPGSIPLGATDNGYTLGGVGSGLFRGPGDGPGVFWMITDRGPNPQDASSPIRRAFPTPWYTPFILQVRAEDNNGPLTVLQALPLYGSDASGVRIAVTGLPNDPNAASPPPPPPPVTQLPLQDERAFTCTLAAGPPGDSQKFTVPLPDNGRNHDGHDTEDIVRDVHGNFWTIEEYGPSISKVDPTGRVLKRFVPVGRGSVSGSVENHFTVVENLPQILGRRPRNRGFEALAITPDQKTLMILVQSPLTNPSTTVGNSSLVIRLIAFDIEAEKPTAEYVYVMQSVDEFKPSPANPTEMKMSAMSALDQFRFLIDERTDLVAKLFVVDIRGATTILGSPWDNLPATTTETTLESLAQYIPGSPSSTTDTLLAHGIVQLPKEFVADLSKLRNPDGTPFNTPQKIEGMTVLDGKTIAIANDNDFRVQNGVNSSTVPPITRVDPTCNPSASGVDSQIMIVRLDNPIKNFPQ